MAQRGGGGRPGGGGGFGGFSGGNSVLGVAMREEVQKHLELLPDQVDDLKKLQEAERESQREAFEEIRNAGQEDRAAAFAKFQETQRRAAAETQKKVDNVLLPHQSKRLSQLAMQRRLRGGISGALTNEDIATQLGISSRERDQLTAKVRDAEAALRDQVTKLRNEMQADLLKNLSPEQQAKYADLIGEPFEFAADERGGGFGGQRGSGQPGGGRGRPTGGRPTRGQRPPQ